MSGRQDSFGLGCVAWLEYDNGGLGWPPGGVVVEVLVDLGPSGPQPLALVACARRARTCRAPSRVSAVAIGMVLQVQPPRGFGRTPPVHRHRDQVGTVLDVADDDLSCPPVRRPVVVSRSVPHPPGFGRHKPNRPRVTRNRARCPCQKDTMNQRGGNRAWRVRADDAGASRSLDTATVWSSGTGSARAGSPKGRGPAPEYRRALSGQLEHGARSRAHPRVRLQSAPGTRHSRSSIGLSCLRTTPKNHTR